MKQSTIKKYLVPIKLKCKNGIYTASTTYYKENISAVISDIALITAHNSGEEFATYKIRQIIIADYVAKNKKPADDKYAEKYFTHDPYYSL